MPRNVHVTLLSKLVGHEKNFLYNSRGVAISTCTSLQCILGCDIVKGAEGSQVNAITSLPYSTKFPRPGISRLGHILNILRKQIPWTKDASLPHPFIVRHIPRPEFMFSTLNEDALLHASVSPLSVLN